VRDVGILYSDRLVFLRKGCSPFVKAAPRIPTLANLNCLHSHTSLSVNVASMSHQITLSILDAYFVRVYTLQDYLNRVLITPEDTTIDDVLLLPSDPPSYSQFLARSYVAFGANAPTSPLAQFDVTTSFDPMRVVRLLFTSYPNQWLIATGHNTCSRKIVFWSEAERCECHNYGVPRCTSRFQFF
jgi:hypothetical protein